MKNISEYGKGVIGIASSFLGRYREFDVCLKDIIAPPGTYVEWALGVNIAKNFNDMARKMLAGDYGWLWILGDDHVFTSDLLIRLLDRDVDMITPFCLRRAEPFDTVVHTCHADHYQRVPKSHFNQASGAFDVTDKTVGNAGTLIRRKVFESIPAPWFENGKSHPEVGGSDLYFCEKVREAGFRMHLDLDNTIGHITHAVIWPHKDIDGNWGYHIACPREGEAILAGDQRQAWVDIFNGWRMNYDKLPYEKQVNIYNRISEVFPNQNRFNQDAIKSFFSYAIDSGMNPHVLEVGGWTGVAAKQMLEDFDKIESWLNIEICKKVAENPTCKSEKYKADSLNDFVWSNGFDYGPHNTLFLSHSLEHMKAENFKAMLTQIQNQGNPIKLIYIDSDLKEKTEEVNWKNYFGTHIMELGWEDLGKMLQEFGYVEFQRTNTARMFSLL